MGRCLSPCLGDLDPNLYRRRLEEALGTFSGSEDGRLVLLAVHERQMQEAAARRQYERAASLRRRHGRLETILGHVEGLLQATHVRPRLVLAPHPVQERFDALWLAGGRLVDFGELPSDTGEVVERTARALRRAGRTGELGAHVPPEEADEMRILSSYLASHRELPEVALVPPPSGAALSRFVACARADASRSQAKGNSTTPAVASSAKETAAPMGTSRRTNAKAMGPRRGETAALVT
jgi:DNA polymerase-3 subunit epsilon